MPTGTITTTIQARAVTTGTGHHFFGYYDKSPWDPTGRWMLGLQSRFMDRPPEPDDTAVLGLIDPQQSSWEPLTETHAWNWQQGCMLQWLGQSDSGDIIFNDRLDDRFVARIRNVRSGQERVLERPICCVSACGQRGVSLNFSRLHHQRPGYGYAGVPDPWQGDPEPAGDGLYALDLITGESRLILSLAEAAAFQRLPEFDGKVHRFNHAQISPDGRSVAVLHRYKPLGCKDVGQTRLLTLSLDGGGLQCLAHSDLVSHYDWRDNRSILVWARLPGGAPTYYLLSLDGASPQVVGAGLFSTDGHCSFSPDRRWVLTDTYPDENDLRTLMLYHWESSERIDIGRFYAPPMRWQIRCDLHPRWSRDGTRVCIDSIHEGSRQIYTLDVADIVNKM